MGIKFRCSACDKKLHVKSFQAGKKGICPKCGAKIRIPAESITTPAVSDKTTNDKPAAQRPQKEVPQPAPKEVPQPVPKEKVAAAPAAPKEPKEPKEAATTTASLPATGPGWSSADDAIAESPESVWYVRPSTGGQFGPADGEIMRRWLAEGRVTADAMVWREGWPDWRSAGPVFPTLLESEAPDLPQTVGSSDRPVSDFSLPETTTPPERWKDRTHRKPQSRNVAIVVALSMLCIALLVTLFLVLMR